MVPTTRRLIGKVKPCQMHNRVSTEIIRPKENPIYSNIAKCMKIITHRLCQVLQTSDLSFFIQDASFVSMD